MGVGVGWGWVWGGSYWGRGEREENLPSPQLDGGFLKENHFIHIHTILTSFPPFAKLKTDR